MNLKRLHENGRFSAGSGGWAAGVLCVVTVLAGCGTKTGSDTLLKAYDLADSLHWTAAEPYIRSYLLEHPEDPGAHYLWGLYYLHGPDTWPGPAEGEFLFALDLIEREGGAGALGSFLDVPQLATFCHRELARIQLQEIHRELAGKVNRRRLRYHLERALEHVEAALALTPGAEGMEELREALQYYEALFGPPPAPASRVIAHQSEMRT